MKAVWDRMGAAMKELFAQELAVELRSVMRDEREENKERQRGSGRSDESEALY